MHTPDTPVCGIPFASDAAGKRRSSTAGRDVAAAHRGAGAFGVAVLKPPTTSAIVAAPRVHDLRSPASTATPAVALAQTPQLMVDGANHGGLWRNPGLPRSVLPMARPAGPAAAKPNPPTETPIARPAR
jgi:hypothetical protein